MLDSINDPHCMNCKNLWSKEFIINATSLQFINTKYKDHRERILFEREKTYLPAAQPLAIVELERRRLLSELYECRKIVEEWRIKENALYRQLRMLSNGSSSTPVNEIVRKCPVDDCRGFLTAEWHCEICSNDICKKCNEPLSDDHECDPGKIETMRLINRDTKPCPHCGTLIHKTSGCSQMWCPSCHTAFNWNTLRIETGIIHNPHYYEFQRSTNSLPRNPLDVQCGGLPCVAQFRRSSLKILNMHRLTSHVQHSELPFFTNVDVDLERLRVKYLVKDITESEWKVALQRNEKKLEKNREISDIIRMYVDTSSELFRQYLDKVLKSEIELLELIHKLIEYFNTNMHPIARRYGCVVPYFHDMHFVRRFNLKGRLTD